MELVTLIEDRSDRPDLRPQHGLSLWIAAGGRRILFDTGRDSLFLENASILGVDIRRADLAVLSHGHYDHGGGLEAFLSQNDHAPVYVGRQADGRFYARGIIGSRYIGIDPALWTHHRERLVTVDSDLEIPVGISLLANIPRPYPLPRGNARLLVVVQNHFEPDPFSHELLLVIREGDGITVLTGCGHSGILNLVAAARDHYPGERIKAVVGGFHLLDSPFPSFRGESPGNIHSLGEELIALGCERVITGHCTGRKAARILKTMLGERLEIMSTGYITRI